MIVAIWPYALDMTDLAQFTCNIDEEKKNKKYEQIGNNNECRLPDTKLSGI
jgi:hypothetical protein